MRIPNLENDRFFPDQGFCVTVQVPSEHAREIIDAVLEQDALRYGDYECVTFESEPGTQSFRSTGEGRNSKTDGVVSVSCMEISFFLPADKARTIKVIKAIYWAHPYEEPVIFVTPCLRTRHIRGLDEHNPNRFWNRNTPAWVPDEHRK